MVSQTLLNLLALTILGGVSLSSVSVLDGHDRALLLFALAPLAVLVALAARAGPDPARGGLALAARCRRCSRLACAARCCACATACACFASPAAPRCATVAQLGAWALQWLSCWLLLMALGLDAQRRRRRRRGVLFAVNVTAVIPATPANVGVFQAACVAVLAGAYHVSTPEAIAYGIVLQVVEVATALIMGLPALRQRGPVLARRAPAHDARDARQAAGAAGVPARAGAGGLSRNSG